MAKAATRGSWKALPLPTVRKPLDLSMTFSETDGDKLKQGHVPKDMDDKWFIFFEEGWLYFHRSWTGACIFAVRLEDAENRMGIVEAWASRDDNQYRSRSVADDKELLLRVIRTQLLG